jgi:hypothetical protein
MPSPTQQLYEDWRLTPIVPILQYPARSGIALGRHEHQLRESKVSVPKGRIGLQFYGLCSADLVVFNESTNAQVAGVTFAILLYSDRACLPADIRLNGSRDFSRKSN